jgi:ubiquinone/menaquinone biosynthesis C-methylase UbiE
MTPSSETNVFTASFLTGISLRGTMTGVTSDRQPRFAPTWFIDELRYAGRENLDAGHVARYDAKEDSSAASEVALLKEIGLTRESLVVEFGAGTGQFSVEVAAACAQVIAVDVSPLMLHQLRAKAAALGLRNIEVVRAGFLTYQHIGSPIDLIYSRFALHHLPDFWKAMALDRLRRMLRPGGVLRLWDVVYDFAPSEAEDRIEAWCATGGDVIEGEWSRAELEEHVRDEHSTFSWLLEPMIRRSGFEITDAEHSDDGIFSKYLLRAA